MNLITLIPKGWFTFLDFFLVAIFTMENEWESEHANDGYAANSIKEVIKIIAEAAK